MKAKDQQELKLKPLAELQKQLADNYERLRGLKFDLAQGKVKNIREIKETKKTIARILTVINKK